MRIKPHTRHRRFTKAEVGYIIDHDGRLPKSLPAREFVRRYHAFLDAKNFLDARSRKDRQMFQRLLAENDDLKKRLRRAEDQRIEAELSALAHDCGITNPATVVNAIDLFAKAVQRDHYLRPEEFFRTLVTHMFEGIYRDWKKGKPIKRSRS
jgi:hypothetical protein